MDILEMLLPKPFSSETIKFVRKKGLVPQYVEMEKAHLAYTLEDLNVGIHHIIVTEKRQSKLVEGFALQILDGRVSNILVCVKNLLALKEPVSLDLHRFPGGVQKYVIERARKESLLGKIRFIAKHRKLLPPKKPIPRERPKLKRPV